MSFRPSSYCAAHCRGPHAVESPVVAMPLPLPTCIQGGTVLAVDNHAEELDHLQQVLLENGFQCLSCSNSAEAVEMARRHELHHLICGAELDGESGLSLYARILETRRTFVPAVFLSSSQSADIIRRTVGTGGSYFVRRPWSSDVLLALLQRLTTVNPVPDQDN